MTHDRYLVALGSNQRHPRHGSPGRVLSAATGRLSQDWQIEAVAPVTSSAPVGPSQRCYANGAVLLAGPYSPPAALALLQAVEAEFGRSRRGQRWRARTLDLDIVLWSGGPWMSEGLTVPHPLFRERPFVLAPTAAIAPRWRDPLTGLTLRQLAFRSRSAP